MFPKSTKKLICYGDVARNSDIPIRYKAYISKNNSSIEEWKYINYFLDFHIFKLDDPNSYYTVSSPIRYSQLINDFEFEVSYRKVNGDKMRLMKNIIFKFLDDMFMPVESINVNIKTIKPDFGSKLFIPVIGKR